LAIFPLKSTFVPQTDNSTATHMLPQEEVHTI
jgi:hypothetical protein